MNQPLLTSEDRFASLVEALCHVPNVTYNPEKKGFGSSALKINNKIFAMIANGRLVVKLPRERVAAMLDTGEGEMFDPGHGRRMKEWLSLNPSSQKNWLDLAKEALAFVGTKS
jgi:hypothetical protein